MAISNRMFQVTLPANALLGPTTYDIASNSIIYVTASGSGSSILYKQSTEAPQTIVVTETPSSVATASGCLFAVTPTSGSATLYLNADMVLDVITTGTGATVYYQSPVKATIQNFVVTETRAAIRSAILALGAGSDPLTTGITAGATQTQAGATLLSYGFNEVTTVTTTGDGVRLPVGIIGAKVTVLNDGANTMQVYPATSGKINDGSVNASINQAPGVELVFENIDGINWESNEQVISTSSVIITPSASAEGLVVSATAHTGSKIIDLITTISDSSVNLIDVAATMSTGFSTGKTLIGENISITSAAADVDASGYIGQNVALISTALSKADLIGYKVVHSGTGSAASGTQDFMGLNVIPTVTLNAGTNNFYGVNVDLSGMTLTSCNDIFGIRAIGKTGVDGVFYGAYGSATLYLLDGSSNGVYLGGTHGTGINITAATTTGISISGATTTGLEIGTSSAKLNVASATARLAQLYSTTSVATASNMTTFTVSQTMTGASAVNTVEASQHIVTSAVQVGNWCNAILAKIDFTTTGYVTGLAGVVCAELDMPSTAPVGGAGTYTVFEAELNMASVSGVPVSVMCANVWGNHAAEFDTNGYLFDITGLTKASGKIFQDNTATAASQALRIRVNGTPYYIMLTSTGA